MENHITWWRLALAAALLATNAVTSNPKPQEVTKHVEQGLALNQEIPTFGPIDVR
jgi:hypothetical protein